MLMSKTPEKLNELKHEYVSLCSKFEELDDEALEKISGGTIYSGSSFDKLGIKPGNGQLGSYHPVIVTWGNTCW